MFVFQLLPARRLAALLFASSILTQPGWAEDLVRFSVQGAAAEKVEDDLRNASALLTAVGDEKTGAEDLFAAAQAEYGALVTTLYALGHYSPVVHVLVDGREAATIPPLDAPNRIGSVVVTVDPGPKFKFSQAKVAPLAPETELPEDFAAGKTAASGLVREAVQAGIEGWREVGHAKAQVASQDVVADHRANTLSADVRLNPGQRLRFGTLSVTGQQRMSERRILKIAGLPEGEVYSPELLKRSADRLRRTGVFKSVSLAEAEQVRAPDLLDISATVVEEKTRRYSIGAEIASFEGLDLSGYWLHRNLLGGGERLKVEAEIGNIGAQSSGVDYVLGVSLDRPATFTPDTTLGLTTEFGHLAEEDFTADVATLGVNLSHYFSERLTARVGLEYSYAKVEDIFDTYTYKHFALPIGATWDSRDDKLDAKKGYYLDGEIRPFLGYGITDSGVRLKADGRAYVTFGETRPVTFAARGQIGAVLGGATILGTPRDYLFYSGGGGTVRGQPYQALGVEIARIYGDKIGGMAFAAGTAEVRARVTSKIGVVGFADVGYVSPFDLGDEFGEWHAGAGLGLRYATGFGPIRLDIATPIKGSVDTGDGVQFYIGIGQAF
ncbi:MAG: outer membrane protein assembly factor [Gemmobacter sp.]|uniref:autotransporter assembly complex protein TamA n=1 Tax=Gemmobacter sp. TaxID=1898957 RepID=UPI001A5BEF99|nr:autotransporter assembly complex family protein [Gemmobacter sp.]MBL8561991.1 outer membrane protein assembly factor [Gemmobacter sp.]